MYEVLVNLQDQNQKVKKLKDGQYQCRKIMYIL